MTIQSRIINRGDPCESDWPPAEPSREKGRFYYDKETRTMKAGDPPDPHPRHDVAPFIITDTIEPYRHPTARCWVDSKSRLRDIDRACGTITTDKEIPPDPTAQKERWRQVREDSHRALHKAVAQLDAGTAPLSEETRKLCEQTNEKVSNALGMDAFNAVGRRNNKRGKRYRKGS